MRKRLLWAVLFNISIVMAEAVGGLLSKSMALLSDAVHNSTDVISMIFALIGVHIAHTKKEDERFTYGYKRAEIVSSLVNSVFMTIMSGFILIEGFKKIFHPHQIDPEVLLPVAIIGLLGNILTLFLLHGDHHHHLNVKAAWIHIMADTISSVFVVLLGILFLFRDYYFLDGVVSVGIAIYMLIMAIPIFKESSFILMQAVVSDIKPYDIENALSKIDGIEDVHHIHVWNMDEENVYVELHIKKSGAANNDELLKKVYDKLKDMGVSHATIQVEEKACPDERGGELSG